MMAELIIGSVLALFLWVWTRYMFGYTIRPTFMIPVEDRGPFVIVRQVQDGIAFNLSYWVPGGGEYWTSSIDHAQRFDKRWLAEWAVTDRLHGQGIVEPLSKYQAVAPQ